MTIDSLSFILGLCLGLACLHLTHRWRDKRDEDNARNGGSAWTVVRMNRERHI